MPTAFRTPSERPRERLLARGPASLSDAELVALFLGTGVRGKSALDVARELLARFGRVSRVLSATQCELDPVPGVGAAKYAQIAAVMELARRALAEEMKARDSLTSPAAVRGYLRLRMACGAPRQPRMRTARTRWNLESWNMAGRSSCGRMHA